MVQHYLQGPPFFGRPLFLTFLLLAFAQLAFGQISGNLTIGPGGDYTNFTAAVQALRTQGVSGPVNFAVSPGIYTERLTLRNIAGLSAVNTVTFEPSGGQVTIQESSDVQQSDGAEDLGFYVVLLDNVSDIIFNNITFSATGANRVVFKFRTSASRVVLMGNTILSNPALATDLFTAYHSQVFFDTNGVFTDNSVQGNAFQRGGYGVCVAGTATGTKINGNAFDDHLQAAIIVSGANSGTSIQENNIRSQEISRAISLSKTTGVSTVLQNIIAANFTNGIFIQNSGSAASPVIVANNIVGGGTNSFAGIYSNGNKNIRYYYNTVKIGSGLENSSAFYMGSDSALTVRNNIFVAEQGVALSVSNYSIAVPDVNNNNYFTKGTALVLSPSQERISTLAVYQTASGWDAQSLNVDPRFVGDDLHTFNANLKGKGTPVAGITIDFEGESRSGNTDIGADEFEVFPLDAGIYPANTQNFYCAPSNSRYSMLIVNNGTTAITTLRINYSINGVGQPFIAWTGNIPSGGSAAYAFNSVNFPVGTSVLFGVTLSQVNGGSDQQPANNAIQETIYLYPKPLLGSDVENCNQQQQLQVANVYETYQWYRDDVAIPGTDTSRYTVSASGIYIVETTDANLCVKRDTVDVKLHYFAPVINITRSPFLCGGDTIVLKAFPNTLGNTYQWALDGTVVPDSTQSHFVAGLNGNYTVKINDGLCEYTSAPLQISVTPVIPISITTSGSTSTCSGTPIILEADPANDDVYFYGWQKDAVPISGPQSSTLSVNEAGDYSVTIFRGLCSYTSGSIHVDVFPSPEASITSTVSQLSAPAGADSYRWFLDGNEIAGATTRILTPEESGTYTVEVTKGICTVTSAGLAFVITGMDDVAGAVTVYPNPTTRKVTIQGANAKAMSFQVVDALGKVSVQPAAYSSGDDTVVDLYGLNAGVYLFRIAVGKQIVVKKVVLVN